MAPAKPVTATPLAASSTREIAYDGASVTPVDNDRGTGGAPLGDAVPEVPNPAALAADGLGCHAGVVEPGDLGLDDATVAADTVRPRHHPVSEASNRNANNEDTEAERRAIIHALETHAGVVARAAAELGLSRQALYRRMDRLGISLERQLRQS